MPQHTASSVIKLAEAQETASARFYDAALQKAPLRPDLFEAYAAENRKNAKLVRRTYYEVVSDALETGFSFRSADLPIDVIEFHSGMDDFSEVVNTAIQIEETLEAFYHLLASQSRSLLADLSRLFDRLAKRRVERAMKLRLLSQQLTEPTS